MDDFAISVLVFPFDFNVFVPVRFCIQIGNGVM